MRNFKLPYTTTSRVTGAMIVMWTCFLLFSAQFTVGLSNTVVRTHCPTNCSCTNEDYAGDFTAGPSLTVDCQAGADVDDEQLADQFDLLLSSNQTYGHLTSLSIINSSLMHVPCSACRLTTLVHLRLDHNRLTRLPDNCLSNLSNLAWFSAHDNAIETLQDGVFDGLSKLQYLDINRNRIRTIGLSVFATSSNLSSLFNIQLSENDLTSLEPWVYDRGIIGSFERMVFVNLSYNEISKFTNKMGFHAELCYRKIPYAVIDLHNNNVNHLSDIYNGWQLSITQIISCYRIERGVLNFQIPLGGKNIPCDCVNYHFYRLIALANLPNDVFLIVSCNLTGSTDGNVKYCGRLRHGS